ncbi:hypothetical protein [uncultured Chitinophaga sp.]|jgi:hypothetical protein|uniref:hypothetical protein n=1 Tax=uncultured Chitinophaga sp. TaxID=339340 RepID=UPI00262EC720|nr:hypothetical protein [uncultured Chitinophaga sp.]
MRYTLHKHTYQQQLSQVFSSPQAIRDLLKEDKVKLPDNLHKWLGRLRLLYGVPFNYLVPDEAMLPPESIRFFYLDMNWIDAMLDGAYSIGRNLTNAAASASANQDRATFATVKSQAENAAAIIRPALLGRKPAPVQWEVVSGFLLRSSLVSRYPGLGVNVYGAGSTPEQPLPLKILRFEALGAGADTMICLVAGDAYQVDLHEAPEQLHYGIDEYTVKDGVTAAAKVLRKFAVSGSEVTIGKDPVKKDISSCFRTSDHRTLNMKALADIVSDLKNNDDSKTPGSKVPVNASEMGFEMTEGVGKVSFIRK